MALSTRTTKRLVRTFLLGQASVTSLVDDRIFGSHLQDSDAETTEFPLVVFALLSGHAAWDTAVQAQSVEIYAFSKRKPRKYTTQCSELFSTNVYRSRGSP